MDDSAASSSPASGRGARHWSDFNLAALNSPGRHGVRIFGVSGNPLAVAAASSIVFGAPLVIVLGMMPFWDNVGDFFIIKYLNYYIAPAIDGLTDEYRFTAAPRFHPKRFLTAYLSMIELMFLFNFVVLFLHGVRKHALLVWTCYSRMKLFQFFGIYCFIFCSVWYLVFFNWKAWVFLAYGGKRIFHLFVAFVLCMPIITVVFGHMAAIVGLGVWRTASRKLRRIFATAVA